jgi:hypothetical protein
MLEPLTILPGVGPRSNGKDERLDRKLAQGVVCLEYGIAPVFVAMPHQNACLSRRMEGGRDPDNSNGTLSVYESDRGHNSLAVVKGTHPGGFAPK